MLSFYSDDLADAGLILVPNGARDYPHLAADIQNRIDKPANDTSTWSPDVREHMLGTIAPDDWQTSAILLNRSGKSIALMMLVWRLTWRSGRIDRHAQKVGSEGSLFPQALDAGVRKMLTYWQTIMPNSKRYISLNSVAGDNSDVRLPEVDELYTGGYFAWGGPPKDQHLLRSVRLSIDGVFFTDGEFVGPNTEQMWEQTRREAELMNCLANVAAEAHRAAQSPEQIFAAIEEIIGPESAAPDLARFNAHAESKFSNQLPKQKVAWSLAHQRQYFGDDAAIAKLLAWSELNPSRLHRR